MFLEDEIKTGLTELDECTCHVLENRRRVLHIVNPAMPSQLLKSEGSPLNLNALPKVCLAVSRSLSHPSPSTWRLCSGLLPLAYHLGTFLVIVLALKWLGG